MHSDQTYKGFCGVRYYERQQFYEGSQRQYGNRGHSVIRGEFEEQVELDLENMMYERFEVPEIRECKKAIILHDFEKVRTVIIMVLAL